MTLKLCGANRAAYDTVNNVYYYNYCYYVQALCRSGWFYLRQLRFIRSSLTRESAESRVHAFVSSRLDNGSAVLSGIGSVLIQRLQLIQNDAARLVSETQKFDHITPVLQEMHWLHVRQRIAYKIADTQMPHFSCNWLSHYGLCAGASTAGRRHLRSVNSSMLVVPRSRTEIGSRYGLYSSVQQSGTAYISSWK